MIFNNLIKVFSDVNEMTNCVTGVMIEGTENRRWHTMNNLNSEVLTRVKQRVSTPTYITRNAEILHTQRINQNKLFHCGLTKMHILHSKYLQHQDITK